MNVTKSKLDNSSPMARIRPDLEFVPHVPRGALTNFKERNQNTTGSRSQAAKKVENWVWLFEGQPRGSRVRQTLQQEHG